MLVAVVLIVLPCVTQTRRLREKEASGRTIVANALGLQGIQHQAPTYAADVSHPGKEFYTEQVPSKSKLGIGLS